MKEPKIVFIGAGSVSFGIATFSDIFTAKELKGAVLSLVDINRENLDRMYGLALKMNEASGLDLKIEKTVSRRDVLPGADFVINSIAVDRFEMWKKDYEIPKKHGIRHCEGENGGPGALFHTMRVFPMIMDIIHDMEELCPDAFFLNFSNPESRIILGVNLYSKIRCAGLCHGIFMAHDDIANILGRDYESIEIRAAGINHFQWVLSIRDSETGEDLYHDFRKKEKKFDPDFQPYSRRMFNFFGLYPTCSDVHLAEYQAYGYEAGENDCNFEEDEIEIKQMKNDIAKITSGEKKASDFLESSGEQAVNMIKSIYFNKKTFFPSAIVLNEGAIPRLPPDFAVEIPVSADKDGIHKEIIDELPEACIDALLLQVPAQRLSVKAAAEGSREIALQALLCDPVINSSFAAEKILDELFEINKPFIRRCI